VEQEHEKGDVDKETKLDENLCGNDQFYNTPGGDDKMEEKKNPEQLKDKEDDKSNEQMANGKEQSQKEDDANKEENVDDQNTENDNKKEDHEEEKVEERENWTKPKAQGIVANSVSATAYFECISLDTEQHCFEGPQACCRSGHHRCWIYPYLILGVPTSYALVIRCEGLPEQFIKVI